MVFIHEFDGAKSSFNCLESLWAEGTFHPSTREHHKISALLRIRQPTIRQTTIRQGHIPKTSNHQGLIRQTFNPQVLEQ